jgi:hypothetical protein
MYTGRLIDELIESVQRVETDAHIFRDDELMSDLILHERVYEYSEYQLAGVA